MEHLDFRPAYVQAYNELCQVVGQREMAEILQNYNPNTGHSQTPSCPYGQVRPLPSSPYQQTSEGQPEESLQTADMYNLYTGNCYNYHSSASLVPNRLYWVPSSTPPLQHLPADRTPTNVTQTGCPWEAFHSRPTQNNATSVCMYAKDSVKSNTYLSATNCNSMKDKPSGSKKNEKNRKIRAVKKPKFRSSPRVILPKGSPGLCDPENIPQSPSSLPCSPVTGSGSPTIMTSSPIIMSPGGDSFKMSPGSNSFKMSPGCDRFKMSPGSDSFKMSRGSDCFKMSPGSNSFNMSPGSDSFNMSPGGNSFKMSPGSDSFKMSPCNDSSKIFPGNKSFRMSLGNDSLNDSGLGTEVCTSLSMISLSMTDQKPLSRSGPHTVLLPIPVPQTPDSNPLPVPAKQGVKRAAKRAACEDALGEPDTKKARHNQPLNLQAIRVMQQWYEENTENPYPSHQEKRDLAAQGNISLAQVKSWFANKRNRNNNTRPKVEKRKMEHKLINICKQLATDNKRPQGTNTHIIKQLAVLLKQAQGQGL